jgi:hypothetical protein
MREFRRSRTLFAALSLALSPLAALAGGAPLPKLGADLNRTSVSGLSSGAYMAGQFQIAHSRDVIGAGIVAGGPFGCAQSAVADSIPIWSLALPYNLEQALNGCTSVQPDYAGALNPQMLALRVRDLAEADAIDPLSELARDRVYLFWGKDDRKVAESVVRAAMRLYMALGVPAANIDFEDGLPGGHAFLTEDAGTVCGLSEPPFISDCDYDQAKAILSFIYGPLQSARPAEPGALIAFDQTPFTDGGATSLDGTGFAYIPRDCREKPGCAVHIVFHGCKQGRSRLGDVFAKESGFGRWAGPNRIIVLYPQAKASFVNPEGCWDWWGYTGLGFLTKDAPQIKAVYAMLGQLAAASGR